MRRTTILLLLLLDRHDHECYMVEFSLLLLQIYSVKKDFDNGDWSSSTAGWGVVDVYMYTSQ